MITYLMLGKHGYLGNQMFQYALLIGISEKNNFSFSIPKNYTSLKDCFDIKCKVYDFEQSYEKIARSLNFYREKYFHYNENVFDLKDNIVYAGNYQSEKYFAHCKEVILEQFSFKKHIKEKSESFINSIKEESKNKQIISVHVRRGDYLNHPNAHPTCSVEWYKQAFAEFKNDDSTFVVFSDDLGWCKQNFSSIDGYDIKFSSLSNNFEDLCSMTMCDHNIIANSSFSWWGAWLNRNDDKKVIAPKVWFGPSYYYHQTKDLYCENWTVL